MAGKPMSTHAVSSVAACQVQSSRPELVSYISRREEDTLDGARPGTWCGWCASLTPTVVVEEP